MKAFISLTLFCATIGLSLQSIAQDLKADKTPFITPFELKIISTPQSSAEAKLCASLPRAAQCPERISNGTVHGGGILLPELGITTGYRNVRASIFVREISNIPIANGGVETTINNGDIELIYWQTSSPESDVEEGGPYAWSLPSPGQTINNFGPHSGFYGLKIYDALVYNACGSLSSFDLSHSAEISEDFAVTDIGSFSATDTSTINSTGYYNMAYTLRATDSEGGISDFSIKGTVNVICSGLNALP